jgi:hypothetical protein
MEGSKRRQRGKGSKEQWNKNKEMAKKEEE